MGTLGPDLGEANPGTLTELLSLDPHDITRQKIQEKLYYPPEWTSSSIRVCAGKGRADTQRSRTDGGAGQPDEIL